MPTPSVEASSQEFDARQGYNFVVVGANFSPKSKLVFDPPLHDHEGFQRRVRRKNACPVYVNALCNPRRRICCVASTFVCL